MFESKQLREVVAVLEEIGTPVKVRLELEVCACEGTIVGVLVPDAIMLLDDEMLRDVRRESGVESVEVRDRRQDSVNVRL